MKRSCFLIGFLVCLYLSMGVLWAQDSTYIEGLGIPQKKRLEWVSQLPPVLTNNKKPFKEWLKRVVLGEKSNTYYNKPVLAIGNGHESAIVLDQGNGTIFFAEGHELSIPKAIKKQDLYFPSLVAACITPYKELLFTDSKLNTIFILSEDKKKIRNINENLTLKQPTGIAYSSVKDQIWVVETAAHQISVLDRNGNRLNIIGTRGYGLGEFNFPTHLWIDDLGTAYVVDALNYRVQIFDSEGNFQSMFGENGNGTGYMARPKGIAVDSHGHIYVVDALFHCVQVFDREGNYLDQFGKQGSDLKEFWMPNGIYIDEEDHIYIADSYNSRIQIIEPIYEE